MWHNKKKQKKTTTTTKTKTKTTITTYVIQSRLREKSYFRKDSKMMCIFKGGKKIKIYLSVLRATLCSARALLMKLVSVGHHVKSVRSQGRTAEWPKVQSQYFRRPIAALCAEDYIGAQFLHTSSVDSVRCGKFGLGSLSIVRTRVSVHTVRGRPERLTASGAVRGSSSSFGSQIECRSGWS